MMLDVIRNKTIDILASKETPLKLHLLMYPTNLFRRSRRRRHPIGELYPALGMVFPEIVLATITELRW
jgi:hypothetical protein